MIKERKTFFHLFSEFTCVCVRARAGEALCSLSDLVVTQTTVPGQQIAGEPEYHVTVENRCICNANRRQAVLRRLRLLPDARRPQHHPPRRRRRRRPLHPQRRRPGDQRPERVLLLRRQDEGQLHARLLHRLLLVII